MTRPIVPPSFIEAIKKQTKPIKRRRIDQKAVIVGKVLYRPQFRLRSAGATCFVGIEVIDADNAETLPGYLELGDYLIVTSSSPAIMDKVEQIDIEDHVRLTIKVVHNRRVLDPRDCVVDFVQRSAFCLTLDHLRSN